MTYDLEESFLTHLQVALLSIPFIMEVWASSSPWAGKWEHWGIPRLSSQSCPTAQARGGVGPLWEAPGAPLSTFLGRGRDRLWAQAWTGRWAWSRDGQGFGDLDTSPGTETDGPSRLWWGPEPHTGAQKVPKWGWARTVRPDIVLRALTYFLLNLYFYIQMIYSHSFYSLSCHLSKLSLLSFTIFFFILPHTALSCIGSWWQFTKKNPNKGADLLKSMKEKDHFSPPAGNTPRNRVQDDLLDYKIKDYHQKSQFLT